MLLAFIPPLRPSTFFMIQSWIVIQQNTEGSPFRTTCHGVLILITSSRAQIRLGFLKGNIRVHSKDLKSVAYKTLVRPQLEYASTVPPPPPHTHTHTHTATDIQKVVAVQRRAARWVFTDYNYTSSVTAILKDLNWRPWTKDA